MVNGQNDPANATIFEDLLAAMKVQLASAQR
jgi:hypothetical protein